MTIRTTCTARREVERWISGRTAEMAVLPLSAVAPDSVFTDLGLSSVQAVELVAAIEDRFGLVLEPTLLFDYPTLEAVAEHVHQLLERS